MNYCQIALLVSATIVLLQQLPITYCNVLFTAGRSLVPVESNISLGSWFGDVMPDSNKLPRNSENVSLIGTHSHGT